MEYIKFDNLTKTRGIHFYADLKRVFGLSIEIKEIPGFIEFRPEPVKLTHPSTIYRLIFLWFKIEYYYQDKNGKYDEVNEPPNNDQPVTT